MFKFKEVTDLELKVNFSEGEAITDLVPGDKCREVFILYEGPEFSKNVFEFLEQLKLYLKSKDF